MLKSYKLTLGRVVENAKEDAPILLFTNPDKREKDQLIEKYGIDRHSLHSALDPDELSRLEFESDHVVFIFKEPKNYSAKEKLVFKTETLGVFYFKKRLIIVTSGDLELTDPEHFNNIDSPLCLFLKLIYMTIFHFFEHLKVINMISAELEQKINRSMENRYLISMFTLEKSLVYYLDAINSNTALIEKLKLNAAKIGFNPEETEYLEDIAIENGQCYKQAEIYSNILASLMDARASIVGNNLNTLMKTLNIITIALMVPTLVVSIFSMNVKIPMSGVEHGFWIIIGLAAISMTAFLLFWRYRKW